MISALRNLGLGLAAVAGGVLISAAGDIGLRVLALVNAASFAVAAAGPGRPTWRMVLRDWPFLGVVAAKLAFVTCALSMTLVLPLYLIRNAGLPGWIAGTVFAVNCALVVIAQSGVVHAIERRSRISAIGLAGLLYAAAGAAPAGYVPPPGGRLHRPGHPRGSRGPECYWSWVLPSGPIAVACTGSSVLRTQYTVFPPDGGKKYDHSLLSASTSIRPRPLSALRPVSLRHGGFMSGSETSITT